MFRPWNATSRFCDGRGDKEQAGGQGHVQGLGHVAAAPGDLVAALDQERRRAQHEGGQRQPGEHLLAPHTRNSSWRPPVVNGCRLRSMPKMRSEAPVNLNVASTSRLAASRP